MNAKHIFLFLIAITFFGCENNHFIKEKKYRIKVQKKFRERKKLAENREEQLFKVFQQNISTAEREALMFLYAYMPLNDLADYNGDFFLQQAQTAFEARSCFSWGDQVPDNLFRHFVLPYRVNNENLDSARWIFFNELKDRIKGMSMKEAALEVNHWCHEKVNYQPTDIRTSSPLATARTSYGRCGEQSTFTVTALRSVCIPARQVYTPRWAHCDDNHAWVEVWVDGDWHYLGACEPEPELDMAWFTKQARRAMLVHTKVFGDYESEDEILQKDKNFTEINVLKNYAETKTVYIKIKNNKNEPVSGAKVDFGLYNYAEFFPIASVLSNKEGLASLETGLGNLFIWISKQNKYTYRKISVEKIDTLILNIDQPPQFENLSLDIHPPKEPTPYTSAGKRNKAFKLKIAREDSIRNAYRAKFIDSISALKLAEKLDISSVKTWKFLNASEGNWKNIQEFIENAHHYGEHWMFSMLESISKKDLRDTRPSILINHLKHTDTTLSKTIPSKVYTQYLLNPRIKNEKLIAYRQHLKKLFTFLNDHKPSEAINKLISWINKNIVINEQCNYYDLPITPIGVLELKVSNKESRNLFFVAVCRSIGIPSRLNPKTKNPQYYANDTWQTIHFDKQQASSANKGFLVLNNSTIKQNITPYYYKHFTLAKRIDGTFQTLDFGYDTPLSEIPDTLELNTGTYRILTGVRKRDGSVLAQLSFFSIKKGETSIIPLIFREKTANKRILGVLKEELKFYTSTKNSITLAFKHPFTLLAWVDNKEPSKHFLLDLQKHKSDFENWNGKAAIIVTSKRLIQPISESIPENIKILFNGHKQNLSKVRRLLQISNSVQYPFIVVIDNERQIIFKSEGYEIGLGEQILNL